MLDELSIFRIYENPMATLVTNDFVKRVHEYNPVISLSEKAIRINKITIKLEASENNGCRITDSQTFKERCTTKPEDNYQTKIQFFFLDNL